MIILTRERISKFFLSPCCHFMPADNGLLIMNRRTESSFFFECESAAAEKLFYLLSNGAEEEELSRLLSSALGDKADSAFETMVLEGLIE